MATNQAYYETLAGLLKWANHRDTSNERTMYNSYIICRHNLDEGYAYHFEPYFINLEMRSTIFDERSYLPLWEILREIDYGQV